MNIDDIPFAELFGMKPKKELTEEQKFGKALLELAAQHPPFNQNNL